MSTRAASRAKLLGPAGVAVLVAWLAWLAGYGLLWWQVRAWAMHPHFFPLVSLWLIQALATATALSAGLWRLARGPRRLAAFCWVLAAVIPLLVYATHTCYVLGCLRDNTLPANLAIRTAVMAGAALADGEARLRFPRRLSGKRVVMIYDRVGDAEQDLTAMDRHVAELESILGRPMEGKVHWVRGTVLGLGPRGFPGLATSRLEDGVSWVDRHEVAHAVHSYYLDADARLPTVLTEGWATLHQSDSKGSLQGPARLRREGLSLPLKDLVGPEWYHRMEGPAYEQGAVLVHYVLREHGGAKFLELCNTCRQETFASDCRRVLGVGLDELDEACEAALREALRVERAAEDPSLWALVDLPEPPPTDEAAREQLLREYPKAAEKLEAAYCHARIAAVKVAQSPPDADGKQPPPRTERLELARRGDRARLVCRGEGWVSVWVAAPNASFLLRKRPEEEELVVRSLWRTGRGYREALEDIDLHGYPLRAPYSVRQRRVVDWMAELNFSIASVTRSEKDGKSLVTVYFENPFWTEDGEVGAQAGWFSLCPDDGWAVQEYEVRSRFSAERRLVWTVNVEYGPKQDGVPVLRCVRAQLLRERELSRLTTRVTDLDFGPVPDSEFKLASFGLEPPDPRPKRVNLFTRLFRASLWALALVASTFVATLVLQVTRRRAGQAAGDADRQDVPDGSDGGDGPGGATYNGPAPRPS